MFKTLRGKLIFSYAAVAALCLGLAVLVMLALATSYEERAVFRSLREKVAIAYPFVQFETANASQQRPAARRVLTRLRDGLTRSGVRILLVDGETMTVTEDTSLRFDAVGKRFPLDDTREDFQDLYSLAGLQDRIRLPGENAAFLYVARALPPARAGEPREIVVFAQARRTFAQIVRDLIEYLGPAALVAMLVSLLAAFLLARSLSRPIARLAEGAEAIARGDYSRRIPVQGQDELAALTQRFNQMAGEVGRAHQMERDFVANVSHDLKTPLTSVLGFSQAMIDGSIVDQEGYRQAAGIINSEGERMSRLVNELLILSRLQGNLQTLELRPLNLADLLSQLALTMQPQALAAGVDLTLVPSPHPVWVHADRDRLQQAFANLVDNAFKHTPPGGTVRLAMELAPTGAQVSVVDTGAGIPTDDLPRVTERFYQVDKSRSSADGTSMGLGLAIAREIILAHHGDIAIDSAQGTGTTVRVTLPAQAGPEHVAATGGMLKRLGRGPQPAEGPPPVAPNGASTGRQMTGGAEEQIGPTSKGI